MSDARSDYILEQMKQANQTVQKFVDLLLHDPNIAHRFRRQELERICEFMYLQNKTSPGVPLIPDNDTSQAARLLIKDYRKVWSKSCMATGMHSNRWPELEELDPIQREKCQLFTICAAIETFGARGLEVQSKTHPLKTHYEPDKKTKATNPYRLNPPTKSQTLHAVQDPSQEASNLFLSSTPTHKDKTKTKKLSSSSSSFNHFEEMTGALAEIEGDKRLKYLRTQPTAPSQPVQKTEFINVHVRGSYANMHHTFRIRGSDHVKDLIDLIEHTFNIDKDEFNLVFNGYFLNPSNTLTQSDIVNDSTVLFQETGVEA